ncbi:pimeloyl-ACP methyl ester carboxylesterase [Streptomyces sp. SAI-127]|nr:pimeloyl-ACP methyl ester carboxylesterase [Streptomyces sp. SAI-127]
MREIELSCGTIAYEDTGGDGPTVVLLHGWMMDASLWDRPIADLSADHRCVAPTLPFVAHLAAVAAQSAGDPQAVPVHVPGVHGPRRIPR